MPVRPWLSILICLILGAFGCMKAAEQAVVPTAETARIDQAVIPDRDLSGEYQERPRGVDAADWTMPPLFLSLAAHFEEEGEEEKAFHYLNRAQEAYAVRKDPSGEALAFSRKILLLLHTGRDREAHDLMREAGDTWTMPPLRAFPEYLDGRLALMHGDFSRARDLLNRSLQDNTDYAADPHLLWLKRDTALAAGMAAILSDHLPRLHAAYRQPEFAGSEMSLPGEGRTHLPDALAINRELRQTRIGLFIPAVDYQRCEAEAYAFMGLDEGMRHPGGEAIRHLTYAADLSRRAGFHEGEILSLLFLGELGLDGENSREGLQAVELLRETADRYRSTPYRIWARLLMARYAREQGQSVRAIAALREADDILSAQRAVIEADMFAQICRSQRRALYQFLVELLAAERRDAEALTAAEKGKSVVMVDLLAGQDIGRNPAVHELLKRERELSDAIRIFQRRLLQAHSDTLIDELLGKLKGAEEAYRELFDRIGREDASLFSLISLRGIDVPSLQSLLDGDTTLFDYFAAERSLYVWAIHRDRIHLERLDLSREELRRLVFSFLDAIRSKNKKRVDSLARRAYDVLLKPIIPFVSGERIGFIPDDCLTYFPFAAMNYRGKFLVEGFSLFYLPNAGFLAQAMTEKTTSDLRILAFGDPDLEDETLDLDHAVEEIETIRKRIGGTTVFLNKLASETKVEEMMAGYDILHFAVRGQFNPAEPLRSGLLLTPDSGQDGTLSALEIFRLSYSGRAVVLTGCDTLPKSDPEGNSFSVLQRAFLFAGSPSVVSSLWLAEDRAVSHFLEQFYRQLGKRGSLADSLRAAQLHLLREGHPPYIWAAFVLMGKY